MLTVNFLWFLIKFKGDMLMTTFKLFLVLLAVTIFVAACSQTATTPNKTITTANINKTGESTPAQPAPTVDELTLAKDLYATNCSICHKENGTGGKVTIEGKTITPADLTSQKVNGRTDEKLLAQITEGVPDEGMPAFKGKLTADQIKSIIKHVRTLQSK